MTSSDLIVKSISKIEFSILSNEYVKDHSVALISNTKHNEIGGVYDLRMGTIEQGKNCETCKKDYIECVGHFGHIELNVEILHPLFIRRAYLLLKCLCFHCHRVLFTKDHIILHNIEKLKGESRLQFILKKIDKI